MSEASRRGKLRQNYAEERNLRPVLNGDEDYHTRGCYLESAVASYLETRVPDDWSLDGDRKRGSDLDGGWHCRGSFHGQYYLWRDWDKQDGIWVFGSTQHAPVILLHGWLRGSECARYAIKRPGKPYQWIPIFKLRQLPGLGADLMEVCGRMAGMAA